MFRKYFLAFPNNANVITISSHHGMNMMRRQCHNAVNVFGLGKNVSVVPWKSSAPVAMARVSLVIHYLGRYSSGLHLEAETMLSLVVQRNLCVCKVKKVSKRTE